MSLYQWNVELSGSVYECLHQFEVILRNALDQQLCGWNALQRDRQTGRAHSTDWLDRMRTVLLAIDPALEAWFISRQRVTATLKTKP